MAPPKKTSPRVTKGKGIQRSRKVITETIHEDHDKFGYYWTIVDNREPSHRSPQIEVWWESPYKMCIRQDNGSTADVVSISLGQSYDLMRVVARALDCGPAD